MICKTTEHEREATSRCVGLPLDGHCPNMVHVIGRRSKAGLDGNTNSFPAAVQRVPSVAVEKRAGTLPTPATTRPVDC